MFVRILAMTSTEISALLSSTSLSPKTTEPGINDSGLLTKPPGTARK